MNEYNEYSNIHFNKQNINNFNEGVTDTNIRDRAYQYQYNSLSKKYKPHGYSLSLACQSGTDILHTVGNVTAIALQFIVDQFPDHTFATAMPSTQIAHRQLRHTPKQIRTQPYPICVVNPRISLSGLDNRLAAGSFATSLWSTTSNRFQNRSEMEVLFFDDQKKIEWRGKINRVVINFDFVLSFQSNAEQLKWASYLINRIPTDGGFFDIDTALELAIPDGFLGETAKYAGIPMKDESGSIAKFADYLNMNAVLPISYRFSSGRHKDAFYMYYMTALLCSIHDLTYNTVSHDGRVETDCPITFTMRCEFNTIGLYDLSVPNPGEYRIITPPSNAIAIPIFSDIVNDADFPLQYGWKILARPFCKLDWGETEIDISSIFGYGLTHMIDYHLENHLPIENFLVVKLRQNRCLIDEGYYVDWKTKKLIFTSVSYTHTYRMLVAVNNLYVNNMLTEMYGKQDNDF